MTSTDNLLGTTNSTLSSTTKPSKLSINELYDLKFQTITEEKKLSEQMYSTIKNGGLSKSSKLAIQNVKDALAISKDSLYTETIGEFFDFTSDFI